MNNKKIFSIFLSLSLLLFLFQEKSYAGLFSDKVPEGKEIKDPYLEKLFAPEFPYESIKVIETKEGKRYVVVKANEKVTEKIRLNYEKNTLLNRGVVIFRSGSPRSNELLISEIRIYRVASEKPYIVEYSEAKGGTLKGKYEVESVVRNQGNYLVILVNKDFGKIFKKVELYPENESKCTEPPFVGKYPNSKSISCTEKSGWISFVYVTRDKAEDVYGYYRDKLSKHYKKVGFKYPERSWKYGDYGMQIDSCYVGSCEVARIGRHVDRLRNETSVKSPISPNGVVFHIVITKVGLKSIIANFSFIEVKYCIDPDVIKTNIKYIRREDRDEN